MKRRPTPAQCRELLEAHRVPVHIRRHSEIVAQLAGGLARSFQNVRGEVLDVALVEAAARLHDIAKAACFENHRDHAAEGGQILRELGYPELAELVARHVELGQWDPAGRVTEAELLNYADKRVRHDEVVSLGERFEDLLRRYGSGSARAAERIRENWDATRAVEAKIFSRLPFGPEALQGWDVSGEGA